MSYKEELNRLIEQWEADCKRLSLVPDDNPHMDESNSNELRRIAYQLTKNAKELRRIEQKKKMSKEFIDVTFDFTMDSPGYWDDFWSRNEGLGAGACDPDACSPTLQKYHQLLWSKILPNGDYLELSCGTGPTYLTWRDMRFGSDSILASFRYRDHRTLIEDVKQHLPNYKEFMENFLHKAYTIGGTIIFPKHYNSMNQRPGTDKLIRDRWDLTMECIRRYYAGESSPLSDVIEYDREFFALFNDFKGYVDFFFLQECVTEDYQQVRFWLGDGRFTDNPLPQTVDDYLTYIAAELDFVGKRNARIKAGGIIDAQRL